MEKGQIETDIRNLERTRREMRWWRAGGALTSLTIVLVCLSMLSSSVRDLTQQGAPQDRYVANLQERLNKDVVPRLQEVASRTITEMQPVVQTEFTRLNTRVPELTQASLKQIDILQKSIPERGEKVLDETLGKALQAQEPKLREMFPTVTDEQVKSLMASLTAMATERGSRLADELLLPHTHRMHSIVEGLRKIQGTEPAPASGEVADWQTGLLILDLVREDLKTLEPKAVSKNPAPKKEVSK